VFAPSCVSHIVLTKYDWNKIIINGISLAQAITLWESEMCKEDGTDADLNLISLTRNNGAHSNRKNHRLNLISNESYLLFDSLSLSFKPSSHHYSPFFKSNGVRHSSSSTSNFERIKKKSKKRRKKKKRRQQQITNDASALRTDKSRINFASHNFLKNKYCNHRLIDTCFWPQCNGDCPKLHNPFTGKVVYLN